jgi:hypothetical protein
MLPPSRAEKGTDATSGQADEKAPLLPKRSPSQTTEGGEEGSPKKTKDSSKKKQKFTKEHVHAMAYDMHALMHQVLDIGAHEPKTMKDGLISNYNNLAIVAAVMATISLSFLTEWHPPEVAPEGPCKTREEKCELVLRSFALVSLFAFVLSALSAIIVINAITLVPVMPDGSCAVTQMVEKVGKGWTRLPHIGLHMGLVTMAVGTCTTSFIYGSMVGALCASSATVTLVALYQLTKQAHMAVLYLNIDSIAQYEDQARAEDIREKIVEVPVPLVIERDKMPMSP